MKYFLLCLFISINLLASSQEEFKLLQKAAAKGQLAALCQLGDYYYYNGFGVEEDKAQAFNCWHKAGKKGHVLSLYNAALCYQKGDGVKKDAAKAFNLLKKAAAQGSQTAQKEIDSLTKFSGNIKQAGKEEAKAQFCIGECYLQGIGVKRDLKKAFQWFNKSAIQGQAEAQLALSSFYAKGISVKRDMKKSLEWTAKAAQQNNLEALLFMAYFSAQQDKVKAEQYASKAIAYCTKADTQGYNKAYDIVLGIYAKGIGVKKDMKKAFQLALALATEERQFTIASHYHYGLGVEVNKKKAIEYYKKAAGSSSTDFNMRSIIYMTLKTIYDEE